MMTSGVHSTSSRMLISGGLVIALESTGMILSITRGRGPTLYAEAMRQFSVRSQDVLMNASVSIRLVVVYSEVCCVRLRFGFVTSSSYWGGWWSGLWGWEDKNAVGPFWRKAVQGCCRSAIHFPVSPPLPSGHGRWSGSCWIWIPMVALIHWVCFLFFWRGQLRFWPLVSLWYFGGSFVWVTSLFAGEWLV